MIKELAKVRKEIKTDLVNISMMLSILENLPKRGVTGKAAFGCGLEDLECINDKPTDFSKSVGQKERLEVQLTEASALNYALEYFRSLGEIEK